MLFKIIIHIFSNKKSHNNYDFLAKLETFSSILFLEISSFFLCMLSKICTHDSFIPQKPNTYIPKYPVSLLANGKNL
jgi:hypothetical protein